MWLVWNVPLGRLAPWVLGLATRRKPHEEVNASNALNALEQENKERKTE